MHPNAPFKHLSVQLGKLGICLRGIGRHKLMLGCNGRILTFPNSPKFYEVVSGGDETEFLLPLKLVKSKHERWGLNLRSGQEVTGALPV